MNTIPIYKVYPIATALGYSYRITTYSHHVTGVTFILHKHKPKIDLIPHFFISVVYNWGDRKVYEKDMGYRTSDSISFITNEPVYHVVKHNITLAKNLRDALQQFLCKNHVEECLRVLEQLIQSEYTLSYI